MRNSLLAVLLSCLLPISAVAQDAPENEAALLQKAEAGDNAAQYALGEYYCQHEEPKAYGAKTLKWWEEAAKSKEPAEAGAAEEALGHFYLSLYAPEDAGTNTVTVYNYDPSKPKPVKYCTGSQHNAENDARALKHFKRCLDFYLNYPTTGCELALGHLHYSEKKYDEAYFWYAELIATDITSGHSTTSSVYTPIDYDGPLLGAEEKIPQEWQKEFSNNFRLAKIAAAKLTKEQIAEGDKKARAGLAEQDKASQDLPPPPDEQGKK